MTPDLRHRCLVLLIRTPRTLREVAADLGISDAQAAKMLGGMAAGRRVWAMNLGGSVVWYALADGLAMVKEAET